MQRGGRSKGTDVGCQTLLTYSGYESFAHCTSFRVQRRTVCWYNDGILTCAILSAHAIGFLAYRSLIRLTIFYPHPGHRQAVPCTGGSPVLYPKTLLAAQQ